MDATVVYTLAPSNIARSAQMSGSASAIAETNKNKKYECLVERGYTFQAVAFEAQGRAGPETEKFW